MENTKALEVATSTEFCQAAGDYRTGGSFGEFADAVAVIIQSAIDEATADLKAQLAERDAQLAAERAMADSLAKVAAPLIGGTYWITQDDIDCAHKVILDYQATRQPNKGGE